MRYTAKDMVLKKFPLAKEAYTGTGKKVIAFGLRVLGNGKSFPAAWADAARRLESR